MTLGTMRTGGERKEVMPMAARPTAGGNDGHSGHTLTSAARSIPATTRRTEVSPAARPGITRGTTGG